MALILTFGEFKDSLKREAKINDASEDTLLMDITNEVLVEICSQTKNLRDLRVDFQQNPITTTGFTYSGYLRDIEQVYYEKYTGATFSRRWELTEQSGVIIPAPLEGFPDAYSVRNTTVLSAVPQMGFTFYPINLGVVGDRVRIIGAGFVSITDDNTVMSYVSFYPMLKRSILQRLQMKRNMDPNKVIPLDKSIERAINAAGTGSADVGGNTIKDE